MISRDFFLPHDKMRKSLILTEEIIQDMFEKG